MQIHKGFTLIELLIVIALLGALAVGLLATIDPFEQLKKGRDTSTRNTVEEFYQSNIRYYASKNVFPWGATTQPTMNLNNGSGSSIISTLVSAGELKDNFAGLVGTGTLNKIYVTGSDPTHVAVCYQPDSKSFQIDPNTYYNQGGTAYAASSNTCLSQFTGGTSCYYCIE